LATLNELDSKKFGEGGNVGDKGTVHIVNENHVFDENQYGAVFDDYDGDGVVNIDDAFPNDKTKQGFVDKVRLQPIFKKLIDLKNNLNTVMYNAVDELKEKSPKTADIYARTKTPYSILKKLVDKRLMDETKGLTDLVGTTIAVDNYNDLIKVKNQIDAGLLGRVVDFDDFYAKPKAGYMAYHYIVKTDEGYSVEVQLKTKRMKNLNKVSHEFYKLGNLDSKNFLEVTQLTHNADLGNKESISQYNKLMNSPDLLREIMTGKIDLKKALEQKSNLFAEGGLVDEILTLRNLLDKEIRTLWGYDKFKGEFNYYELYITEGTRGSTDIRTIKDYEEAIKEYYQESKKEPNLVTLYGYHDGKTIRLISNSAFFVINDTTKEIASIAYDDLNSANSRLIEIIKEKGDINYSVKRIYKNITKTDKGYAKGGVSEDSKFGKQISVSDQEIFEQQFGKM
jgi:ppGpp synthetase/RelA/SpoT-type nucleotidyltranferase